MSDLIRMIYRPIGKELRTETLLPRGDDDPTELYVHPKAVDAHRAAGWIVPRPHPLRRSTDRE